MANAAVARRPAFPVRPQTVHKLVDGVFGDDMHAKRVLSLSNAAMGAIASGSLAIHMIGQGLAQAMESDPKHCIKQVDRLLSNPHLQVWEMFSDWSLSFRETGRKRSWHWIGPISTVMAIPPRFSAW